MRNQESLKQQGDVVWSIGHLLRGPCEIPFNGHVHEYKPQCDLAAMLKEITA